MKENVTEEVLHYEVCAERIRGCAQSLNTLVRTLTIRLCHIEVTLRKFARWSEDGGCSKMLVDGRRR